MLFRGLVQFELDSCLGWIPFGFWFGLYVGPTVLFIFTVDFELRASDTERKFRTEEREAENATQLSLSLFLSLTPPRRRVGDSDRRRRFAGEVWFPCSGEFVLWCVRSPACAFAFCSVESSPLVFV